MTVSSLKGLFRIQDAWYLLALPALACLPLVLIDFLYDADLSLALPITLLGIFTARGLSNLKVKRLSAGIILLGLGPLALILRIGGMWYSLFEFVKGFFDFIASLFGFLDIRSQVDFSSLLLAREELLQKILGLGSRFMLWCSGFLRGAESEDPVVQTLLWCLVLWLTAVWAGWQMHRQNRLLTGIFPTTLLLGFIVNYTGKEVEILLVHLGLLLFLLGLTKFAEQKNRWDLLKTDYSESTILDTLAAVVMVTGALMAFSFFASTKSVGEIVDELREKRQPTVVEAQGGLPGLEPVRDNARITGIGNGLPRSHLIKSGPELSRQLVMTISTGELSPMPEIAYVTAPRHYWRTLTYQVYDGRGWLNPLAFGSDVTANEKLIAEIPPGYQVLTQSVTFANETGDRLYWSGALLGADVPFQAAWLRKAGSIPLLHSDMLAALASTKSYRAESLELKMDAKTLRESPGTYPEWVQRQFLSLPDLVPSRVYALARDLTASESTPYDRALSIESYLRTFPYTLEVDAPPPSRDAADYFLFDLKQGYCDYYATAMVVLARAAGLPARLVVGYANGAYDYEHAQYVVTENYAHSWVEIYFANVGWVEFEPTASFPVISHDEKAESTVPVAESQPVEQSSSWKFVSFLQSVFDNARIPILIVFACGLSWIGFDSFRLNHLAPSRTIQLLYSRLRRLARPITGQPSRNQTAYSYASNLIQHLSTFEVSPRLQNWLAPSHNEIQKLTDLFSRNLFAPQPSTRADANDALKNWSRLRWRLILANVIRAINK
ncbi:Protein-glutamine gamma-glutamyltransferase [Anaerolineales bacterium]|nr:Protein-glutamine gamma-glutamyltransferase [Anaerolineales bacterium]